MNNSLLVVVLASGVAYGTPLLYAALGELLAERSGVLNLGVEGMMLVGAVMGFWTVQRLHGASSLVLVGAIGVAALAGAVMAAIHAFLVITLRANQIVSGLALTIFAGAVGLSSYLGNDLKLAGEPARHQFQEIFPKSLQDLPVVGPIVFGQSILVYASWICVVLVALYLTRTRVGLNVRAVGESPAAADAMGINVAGYRYAHTLVGGAFAGIAGATFSLSITPQWVDGITRGAGWIAIALVIFAFWRPTLCLVGAYFFGAFTALPFALQGHGVTLAPELFQTLPYVATVVALVLVSSRAARLRGTRSAGLPARALGRPAPANVRRPPRSWRSGSRQADRPCSRSTSGRTERAALSRSHRPDRGATRRVTGSSSRSPVRCRRRARRTGSTPTGRSSGLG